MKLILTAIAFIVCLSSCSVFQKNHYSTPIGAEMIEKYCQAGFKPRNKREKAEYKATWKQVNRDRRLAKKQQKQQG